jgi:rhamnosyltransferase
MTSTARDAVRCVVVTWNPDVERLAAVLDALTPQVAGIIVVDNGSRDFDALATRWSGHEELEFVGLPENRGIAAALNAGVTRALAKDPAWILTMDQDTLVGDGAVAAALDDLAALDEPIRSRCALVALRPHPQPASIWLTRYAERLLVTGSLGAFVERRGVITSGNLVRADVAREVAYDERLFIDQVDFDFCYSLRRRGFRVVQQTTITMDHILGERYDDVERLHPYENAQRLYYIVRNSTYLVLRRRLLVRHYAAQVVMFCGAYVSVNGARSAAQCARVVAVGVADGVLGRLGRREYRFLAQGRR